MICIPEINTILTKSGREKAAPDGQLEGLHQLSLPTAL